MVNTWQARPRFGPVGALKVSAAADDVSVFKSGEKKKMQSVELRSRQEG